MGIRKVISYLHSSQPARVRGLGARVAVYAFRRPLHRAGHNSEATRGRPWRRIRHRRRCRRTCRARRRLWSLRCGGCDSRVPLLPLAHRPQYALLHRR